MHRSIARKSLYYTAFLTPAEFYKRECKMHEHRAARGESKKTLILQAF